MKPLQHARNSARKWGGIPSDYQALHDFFDSSKAALPDVRHRAILHSSFGIFLVERVPYFCRCGQALLGRVELFFRSSINRP
jgi:hypothetical protein